MLEDIRFFKEEEVAKALEKDRFHPYMDTIMTFSYPEKTAEEKMEILTSINGIQDFQSNIAYNAIQQIILNKSQGFTTSGLENLDRDTAYLFMSNHRDILLDTSLLNYALFEANMILTASAIGDNLVTDPFVKNLSKYNRNFLIKRNVSPRVLLQSSQTVSKYIHDLVTIDNQSVWIAQREGRAKDGDDRTMPGVLKMIAMTDRKNPIEHLKKLKIVPVAVSYGYDPTDVRKVKELAVKSLGMEYIKGKQEDFESIIWGATGQKGPMHISFGQPLEEILDPLKDTINQKDLFMSIAQIIDKQIHQLYHLHASNWIAYDILKGHEEHLGPFYTTDEKTYFLDRMTKRQEKYQVSNTFLFLKMYANPVFNALAESL